jgi:hypothetical protein
MLRLGTIEYESETVPSKFGPAKFAIPGDSILFANLADRRLEVRYRQTSATRRY